MRTIVGPEPTFKTPNDVTPLASRIYYSVRGYGNSRIKNLVPAIQD